MSKLARIWLATTAIVSAPSALAIHVESDHPGLQRPQAQLVEDARAAEARINGGATSIATSEFTGTALQGVKRKAFPPGYGLSGYEFEDEILRNASPATEEPKAQAEPPAPKR